MPLKILIIYSVLFTALLGSNSVYAFNLPKNFSNADLPNPPLFAPPSGTVQQHPTTSLKNKEGISDKHVLLKSYHNWKGVKYRLGGDSRKGIDCSAFTRRMAKEFSVHLPRTTAAQMRSGQKITKQQLKVGDLVFFKTSRQDRHVGIYIGDDQFIHASRKKGVITSSMNNTYWVTRYETSVRVIG